MTPVFLGMLLAWFLLSALIGLILSSAGQGGWISGILCGALPLFIVTPLRVVMSKAITQAKGIDEVPPMAFNLPVRILITAIIAAVASYVIIVVAELPLGLISAAFIGLVTGTITILVFATRIMTSD